MPTYEYECQECGHRFDAFQQMSEGALRKCPQCGRLKLKRQIGAGAGLIFRGSGFYETDYKRKGGGSTDSKAEKKKDGGGDAGKSGDGGGKKDGGSSS